MRKLLLSLCPLLLITPAAPPSTPKHPAHVISERDRALDFYPNLCFEDEQARLDNFAITLQENPDLVGLIVVYAGPRSCVGEAQYRAERARKWVEGRGVAADRILWKDGGYLDEAMTWLWVIPRDMVEKRWPALTSLERDKVKVFSRCKGKVYRPAKCNNP